jgi:hypothetical protein
MSIAIWRTHLGSPDLIFVVNPFLAEKEPERKGAYAPTHTIFRKFLDRLEQIPRKYINEREGSENL